MFPYILLLKWNEISNILYSLGTSYDRVNEFTKNEAILISEKYCLSEKKVSFPAFLYLLENSYIDLDGYLHERGKQYFELAFVHNDIESSNNFIVNDLLHNAIVNLVIQVFYGRGKISKNQLCNLLNFHKVALSLISEKDINSFLIFLNKFSIVTYDKKNGMFFVNELVHSEFEIKQYFMEPTTPFSNIFNFRKALRTCKGNLFWIDKHFRKEGFELIIDGLSCEGINSVTIISGKDNLTQSAKNDYIALKAELLNRFIELDWRLLEDQHFKWHDRWIISDSNCYNIPPVLAIIRGQRSEILRTESTIDINAFISASKSIDV